MEQRNKEDCTSFLFPGHLCHSYLLSVNLHFSSIKLGGKNPLIEALMMPQSSLLLSHSCSISRQQTTAI